MKTRVCRDIKSNGLGRSFGEGQTLTTSLYYSLCGGETPLSCGIFIEMNKITEGYRKYNIFGSQARRRRGLSHSILIEFYKITEGHGDAKVIFSTKWIDSYGSLHSAY